MKLETKIIFLFKCYFTLYFLGVNAVQGAACNSEDNVKDFCANPVMSENPVDVKWLHEHVEQGWNIQFGNSVMRKRLTNLIRGKAGSNEEDYSDMCARLKLDYVENHIAGVFRGFGGKEAFFNCTEDAGFECKFTSSDRLTVETVKAYATYFDNKGKDEHNMLASAFCYENGDVGWYVMTVSPTISEEEKSTIVEHFKSLGFNPDLQVPYSTSSC